MSYQFLFFIMETSNANKKFLALMAEIMNTKRPEAFTTIVMSINS